MTVGSHNFVKFAVIKPSCQKHSGCVFASDKNAMYTTHAPTNFITTSRNIVVVLLAKWHRKKSLGCGRAGGGIKMNMMGSYGT